MDEEEKEEIKELINLLYNNHISQYGKRKLENYIKELQKENDTLKTTINKQSKDISEQLKELDKKDKIINLIVNYLAEEDVSETFCKTEYFNIDCANEAYKCEDCIKEYFYKKVEEEK